MKTLFAILLTASAAFAQATVTYKQMGPNCAPNLSAFEEIASGCPWSTIQVTAVPSTPQAIGFMVILTYRESNGRQITLTSFAMTRASDGTFTCSFIDPMDIISMNVTAQELEPGPLVHAR